MITERVRAEYLEMPGLQLKSEEVQRLCGIEHTMCQLALDTLVGSKFLCVRADGRYARLTEGYISHPRPAQTDLAADKRSRKTA